MAAKLTQGRHGAENTIWLRIEITINKHNISQNAGTKFK
jgi:hypothetical protein